ncbi:MAG: formate dehydrogenase accessory sulfurtransferase FdhD, partial [Thermodesulfobacteriota bacterium]
MTEPIQEFPVRRYRPEGMEEVTDPVAVEEPLEIRLSGEPFQVLMRLPGLEKELAVGFLYTEGIIKNLGDITTLHFCGTATDPLLPPNVVDIVLSDAARARTGRRHLEVAYSSCSLCAKEAVEEICRKLDPVTSDLTVKRRTITALMERMAASQEVFKKTGGTHGVALATPD